MRIIGQRGRAVAVPVRRDRLRPVGIGSHWFFESRGLFLPEHTTAVTVGEPARSPCHSVVTDGGYVRRLDITDGDFHVMTQARAVREEEARSRPTKQAPKRGDLQLATSAERDLAVDTASGPLALTLLTVGPIRRGEAAVFGGAIQRSSPPGLADFVESSDLALQLEVRVDRVAECHCISRCGQSICRGQALPGPARGRLPVAASGAISSLGRRGDIRLPEMAVRDLWALPVRAPGCHDEIGRDAKDPFDAVGIGPAMVLDEDHPLIGRNDGRLGVFELVPGERQLEEFQKRVLVILHRRQSGVVPRRGRVEHTRLPTPGVADRGRDVNVIEDRDEANCLSRLDSWHVVLLMRCAGELLSDGFTRT